MDFLGIPEQSRDPVELEIMLEQLADLPPGAPVEIHYMEFSNPLAEFAMLGFLREKFTSASPVIALKNGGSKGERLSDSASRLYRELDIPVAQFTGYEYLNVVDLLLDPMTPLAVHYFEPPNLEAGFTFLGFLGREFTPTSRTLTLANGCSRDSPELGFQSKLNYQTEIPIENFIQYRTLASID